MNDPIRTYGLGVLLASSFFGFHHVMAALKTSCPNAERKHWDHLGDLLIGVLLVYVLGYLAQGFWEIL